ncbi:MAG: hypothetical protein JNN20_20165 [Betaproteobacteria bacterium]|nr:hypothetical protein [Betaproteobacteria bacterium]
MSIAQLCVQSTRRDPDRYWKSLTALGNVLCANEQFGAALDAHADALELALSQADAARMAMSWNNLGTIFLTASAWDIAVECFSRITENPTLVKAWRPYQAHGNLALCHLHLDSIRQGVESMRQALRLETPELITHNPRTYVAFRLTYIQLALQGNRIWPQEIKRRANEAREFAAAHADPHISVLSELIAANIEFAFGDREASLRKMESLRIRARVVPQVLSDVLFALVQAGKLTGNAERARVYLDEWSIHLYAEADQHAKARLGISGWLPTGAFLCDHWNELGSGAERLPGLPARVLELMKGSQDGAS